MQGNLLVITKLNELLADELSAINQYMVHAEMCKNWGYKKLHDIVEGHAIGEMKHASELIERILFLEGFPIVDKLSPITIGTTIEQQIAFDLEAELKAVRAYNSAARLFYELDDNGSREIAEKFLTDEESHVDWAEAQIVLIAQMGIENYLSTQT